MASKEVSHDDQHGIFTARILRTFSLILAAATLLTTLAATASAQNPVPLIDQPLVPDATAPGGPAFTLTVNGAGFVSASVVNWNGSPRATTFISSSQLTAKILASDIAKASTAAVTVINPNPGGISNTQFFSIAVPKTSISFAPAVTYNSGGIYPGSLVVADVNGDGKPDMIVANFGGTSSVGVLLGNGDGTFQPATVITNIGSIAEANALAVADVSGDGKLDLIVATCCESNGDAEAAVLLGNGDGTFRAPLFYDASSASEATEAMAVADLNGDGKPDIVEVNWSPPTVRVLLGNGDGTFQPAMTFSAPADPACLTISDVNKDGIPDLLICSQNSVAVLLGNGNGTFQPFTNTNFHTGNCTPAVAIADVNGDGLPDMVDANAGPDSCGPVGFAGILLGNGDGTFQPEVNYVAVNYTHDGVGLVAVSDVNGDGKPDAVVASGMGLYIPVQGSVGVLLGNGDGTFQAPASFGAGGVFSYSVVVADVNGDGRPDILVANFASSTVAVLLNNSESSSPTTATTLASTPEPSTFGQPVTFTAAVTSASGPPTGTVVFTDTSTSTTLGSVALISGTASISVSSLATGSHSITATYEGSATFSPSTSAPLSQSVKIATTTTSLTSSPNPAATSKSVTFTATVTSQYGGAATGSVTFLSGSQTLGTATLSGNRAILTTSFATAGTYSISAKYSGDNNNTGSTSSTLSQVITVATTTTLVSSLNPSLIAQAVTFTATVSSTAGAPPNGEIVTFYNASAVLGTAPLSVGVASLTTSSLLAGIYTITAAYDGDSTFAASTSPGLRQVVNSTTKSGTATTLISSLNPSIYGQKVVWTATVTTSGPVPPTGKVNFSWNGNSIGTASLNATGVATLTRSALNADTYPLTAVYQGDTNNLASRSPVLIQVVTETTSSAALTSSPNPSTAGEAVTFTATIKSPTIAATGPVTFSAGKTVLGTAQLANGKATFTISTLPVGTTTVTANYYGDSNISGSSASATESVQP